MMTRSLCGRFALLLAGVFGVVSASTAVQGQDPFGTAPDSGNRVESSRCSKSAAKEPERIFRTNEEWRKLLTAEQFMVARMKATEQPFSGKYASGHFKGTFVCVCCGAKLFDASNKFESGTGWPSFWRPVSEKALDTAMDYSEPAEARVEVACHRCGAHLGHVFQDGELGRAFSGVGARRSHSIPQVEPHAGIEIDQQGQALERRHRDQEARQAGQSD